MSHQATTNHLGNLGNLDEQWVDFFAPNEGGQLVSVPDANANAMELALVPSHHAMGALVAAPDRGSKRLAPSHEPEAQRIARQKLKERKKKAQKDMEEANEVLTQDNAALRVALSAKIAELEDLQGKPQRAALSFFKNRGGVAPILCVTRYDGKGGGYANYNITFRQCIDHEYASFIEGRRLAREEVRGGATATTKEAAKKAAKKEKDKSPCESVTFDDDIQEDGGGHSCYWVPKTMDAWKGYEPLEKYMQFVHEELVGYVSRRKGKYGRGISILDTGDPWACGPVGCPRTHSHRDFDKHRCNSLTVILFLQEDALIFPYLGGEYKLEAKAGDMCMFPTSVFHQGASMEDLHGNKVGPSRRRVFLYMDWETAVTDSLGQVITEKELGGMPPDYKLHVYEVSSLRAAYLLMSSPFVDGRIYQTENLFVSNMHTR